MYKITETQTIIIYALLGMIFIPSATTLICHGYETMTCNNRYTDSKYNFWAGCMIKYEGEYIPEDLYIRAFEQNIKLTK